MRDSAKTPLHCITALLDPPRVLGHHRLFASAAATCHPAVTADEFARLAAMWEIFKLDKARADLL